MRANYQGSTHTDVNTDSLVWRIADKARDLRLQEVVEGRESAANHVPDLRALGREKFESSSLATFNKKIRLSIDGRPIEIEEDELTPLVGFDIQEIHYAGDGDIEID